MSTKTILATLAFVALAACKMPVSIDTPPLTPVLTASGQAKLAEGGGVVDVRTFENVGKKRVWLEDVVGVTCQLSSPNFRTLSFQTPRSINVPEFMDQRPRATLTCSYEGETKRVGLTCYKLRGKQSCSYADVSIIFKR